MSLEVKPQSGLKRRVHENVTHRFLQNLKTEFESITTLAPYEATLNYSESEYVEYVRKKVAKLVVKKQWS